MYLDSVKKTSIQCCVHLTGIQGVVCSCPPGYVGNGQGSNGCVTQGVTDGPCASNPCRNGALCQVLHAITTLLTHTSLLFEKKSSFL